MNPALARLRGLGTTGLMALALLVVLGVGSIAEAMQGGRLISSSNVSHMLSGMGVLGFVAIGQTLVVLCRSLDLSVGYSLAATTLVAAITMNGQSDRVALGVLAAVGVAAAIGLVNGLIITKLRVNSFIATLGVGIIIKGYLDTRYQGPAGAVPRSFQRVGLNKIWVFPWQTLIMLGLAAVVFVLLSRTRLGHSMYAVGGSEEVARLSGLRTHRTVIAAHTLCGVCVGLGGVILASRFGTGYASAVYQAGYDLNSIAAVVLGGTALTGGRGSVIGTVLGVAMLAVLDTTFDALGINPFFKQVLRGVIVVVAVALYARRQLARRAVRERFDRDGNDARVAPPVEVTVPAEIELPAELGAATAEGASR